MESLIFECPMCSISLTGFDNYQKHVNSQEHALMINRKNLENLTDQGMVHDQSVSQVKELISNSSSSSNVKLPLQNDAKNSLNLECQICQKYFTGIVPYEQHLGSALHLKNSGTNLSEACKSNILKCDICDKAFSGSVPYNQHMISNVHKKKVHAKHLFEQVKNASSSSGIDETSESYANSFSSMDESSCESDASSIGKIESSPFQPCTMGVLRCDICDKNFSGIIPYDQHQKSSGHTKKLQMNRCEKSFLILGSLSTDNIDTMSSNSNDVEMENAQSMQINQVSNVLGWRCEICDKQFTGPVPYEQHLVSSVHKKALEKRPGVAHPSTNSITNTSEQSFDSNKICNTQNNVGSQLQCKMCDKVFSGHVPLEMHLSSNAHKKKILEKKIEKKNNIGIHVPDSSINNETKPLSQTSQIPTTPEKNSDNQDRDSAIQSPISAELSPSKPETSLEDPCLESRNLHGDSGINLICEENHSDSILEEDQCFVTAENLNITVFKPDEEIKF